MYEFKKYMHIEKFGTEDVQGIELGECYVFPKLDGTNASVWLGRRTKTESRVTAGSRNRILSIRNDNAGFCKFVSASLPICSFIHKHKNLTLYGEWLVPHTLKTYRENAWKRFWIFDVFNNETEQLLSYDIYKPLLEEFGLDFIPPLAKIKNGSYDNFIHVLGNNNFFIKDGEGTGEGIVIKNYDFYNHHGKQLWAKIITSEFKEKHHKEMGIPETGGRLVEEEVVDRYQSTAMMEKVYAKIKVEMDGWKSAYIPRLLDTVYYDLINEELWEALKEFKNPTINFKTLKSFSVSKTKQILKEVF